MNQVFYIFPPHDDEDHDDADADDDFALRYLIKVRKQFSENDLYSNGNTLLLHLLGCLPLWIFHSPFSHFRLISRRYLMMERAFFLARVKKKTYFQNGNLIHLIEIISNYSGKIPSKRLTVLEQFESVLRILA